jgi:hypothetical protein
VVASDGASTSGGAASVDRVTSTGSAAGSGTLEGVSRMVGGNEATGNVEEGTGSVLRLVTVSRCTSAEAVERSLDDGWTGSGAAAGATGATGWLARMDDPASKTTGDGPTVRAAGTSCSEEGVDAADVTSPPISDAVEAVAVVVHGRSNQRVDTPSSRWRLTVARPATTPAGASATTA